MMRERARRLFLCSRGAAAVEFALVMPAFLALVLGGLSVCVLMYSNVSLQDATERGARCFSVDTATCSSATAAQTFAQGFYYGVGAPTFTASTPACGHQVVGTLTLQIAAVLTNITVPLTASACFP
jgi:Flp pilus assembly protein TadG